MLIYVKIRTKIIKKNLIYVNFMLIYVNITDRQTNTSKVQFGTSQKINFVSMCWVSIQIFFLISKIDTQIHTQKIKFYYFRLSFSKFARDSQNTQTQNSNPQKI